MQNAAARLLNSACKYGHITPILKELHWLPVRFRIHFKILLLSFKALNGMAPDYITELINVRDIDVTRCAPIRALLFPTQWGRCLNRLVIDLLMWLRQLFGINFPQIFVTLVLYLLLNCA